MTSPPLASLRSPSPRRARSASLSPPGPVILSVAPKLKKEKKSSGELEIGGRQRLTVGSGEEVDLGIVNAVDDAGRGEVEDADGASDCGEDGGRVEEVDLEEVEPRRRALQRSQVLRLAFILCSHRTARLPNTSQAPAKWVYNYSVTYAYILEDVMNN